MPLAIPKDPFSPAPKHHVNIVVLGAKSVGKTSVTLQFITEAPVDSSNCKPTIEDVFCKEIELDHMEDESDSVFHNEIGAECLWKMEDEISDRNYSTSSTHGMSNKMRSSKLTNNNETEENMKVVLNVTDTARYVASSNQRKSFRWRIAQRLTRKKQPGASLPDTAPTRRKYYHHNNSTPVRTRSTVPSFIYRKKEDGTSRHDHHIQTADAFVLVYSVKDKTSFAALREIRSRIIHSRGLPEDLMGNSHKPRRESKELTDELELSPFTPLTNKRLRKLKKNNAILPPVFIVGTHLDQADSSPNMFLSPPSDFTSGSMDTLFRRAIDPHTHDHINLSENRKHLKQISASPEIVSSNFNFGTKEVTSEYVRGVVGSWSECAGYAEVSNESVSRIRRVYEHLAGRVVRNRIADEKRNFSPRSSSPRKRLDSALHAIRKHSGEVNISCFCFSVKK